MGMPLLEKNSRIFITGSTGLLGRALVRTLRKEGFDHLLTPPHAELNLLNAKATWSFFEDQQPDIVLHCAARVGGIQANQDYPATLLLENLELTTHIVRASFEFKVKTLLCFGSSCMFPKEAPQPLRESDLLTGPLEATNESYALAKIATVKLCEAFQKQYGAHFISAIPANLYGPYDNFNIQTSHVVSGMMKRMAKAKEEQEPRFVVWGSGQQIRDFLYVDDCAEAVVFLLKNYTGRAPINIGSNHGCPIRELAEALAEVVGYKGTLVFDTSRPDGMAKKILDTSALYALGWKPRYSLKEGLALAYQWAMKHQLLS